MKTTFWQRINQLLNDSVPVEREKDVLTDHEYDGIRELDNNLPPWWIYGFYLTIAFSIVYMIHYHITQTGPSSQQEYQAELVAAEASRQAYLASIGEIIDENTVVQLTDVAELEKASTIFVEKCAACHTATGGGLVGPNLTDAYWIHGGGIQNIFKVIKNGVPAKGMVPWQGILTPEQIQSVASYIMSLEGSNPPGGLPPQGDLYIKQTAERTANQ